MQLSIIIVNYNVKYFLEHCLLSVIKACNGIAVEIIVIDNNSTDDSKFYLENKFTTVQFYWNKENLGFGKANNYALQFAKGEHILFLNPDTIVPEDCFTKCLSFFKKEIDCGAIGVRLIDGSGQFLKESKRSLPTPLGGFFKMLRLAEAFPTSKTFAQYYAGFLLENENSKVDVLAGAFMMLSKKAIEITKGFDESFFMYGEDIDLSYRIQKAGLQNYYLGENTIIHFKGESTQKKSDAYIKHFYGAIERFVGKHYSQQWFKKTSMNFVINIGKNAAFFKNKFFYTKQVIAEIEKKNILIIGSTKEISQVKEILINSITTTIDCEIALDTTAIELSTIAKEKQTHNIVLCEGLLTNKIIIEALGKIQKKITVYFYASGAKSIICSNNKNETGFIIASA